jgi:hypothetical protein
MPKKDLVKRGGNPVTNANDHARNSSPPRPDNFVLGGYTCIFHNRRRPGDISCTRRRRRSCRAGRARLQRPTTWRAPMPSQEQETASDALQFANSWKLLRGDKFSQAAIHARKADSAPYERPAVTPMGTQRSTFSQSTHTEADDRGTSSCASRGQHAEHALLRLPRVVRAKLGPRLSGFPAREQSRPVARSIHHKRLRSEMGSGVRAGKKRAPQEPSPIIATSSRPSCSPR